MRFLKEQNLNKYRRTDHTVSHDIYGQVNLATTYSVALPSGTTLQRPGTPSPGPAHVNGQIRYNTDTNEIEAYSNGAWRALRYKEPTTITYQTIGTGDYVATYFGPLTPTNESGYANSDGIVVFGSDYGKNIMVFVENVFQIWTTNYVLEQNPVGHPSGWYIKFTSAPPNKPITVIYGFDN